MRFLRSIFGHSVSRDSSPIKAMLSSGLLALTGLTLIIAASTKTVAATSSNSQSPLGVLLNSINYWSSEMPFINVFVSNSGWITHSSSVWDTHEEKYLKLDSNGWPISLKSQNENSGQQFNSVGVLVLRSLPSTPNGYYPGGKYVVLYQGQGTITYTGDATLLSRAPGRDTINVANPTAAGIDIRITATDPNNTGNYIRNISVLQAGNMPAYSAGQIFNPRFLSAISNFRALRFMGWLSINDSTLSSWADRPLQSNAFWGTSNGVPIEVAVQLANTVSADAWLNVPIMADDNYVTQMATLVHGLLGSSQKVYVELSNEVWNYTFSQATYATTQGHSAFASGQGNPFDYNLNWYGMRVAQTCDMWKSVWGSDAERVVCVMASQGANTYTATQSLSCPFWKSGAPCSSHGIGAVAIAPYFAFSVPAAWASQTSSGLGDLFSSFTSKNDASIPADGALAAASRNEAAYSAMLASYKLPLIAYESGQSLIAFPNGVTSTGANTPLTNLYIAANRDPRMGAAYTTYYQQWKANGGTLMIVFSDIATYGQYGEWGMLESLMQTFNPVSSAPPKWQAAQNFISANPCWWSDCVGKVVSVVTPAAPTGVRIN
jgi:hypothetical protein